MINHLQHTKTIIIIVGPTAVGKTALAIQLAQYFKTQIISADSRQCFKELTIGTAKPSPEELAQVRHYFINSHSIADEINVGIYEQYALNACAQIFNQHNIAVMVGGTGLYIKAFCEGIDSIPAISAAIREYIVAQYNQFGLSWLQETLAAKDPVFWQTAEQQNPQRLMRALEVFETTGKSINTFKNKRVIERPFNIIKIGLELPREQLVENINIRVEQMIYKGLLDEVKSLKEYQYLNALQTVGYKELFAFLNGNCNLPQAINQIKINTRQYAKRQMTWFKKDTSIRWMTSDKTVFETVRNILLESALI
ncbi:MAG: tRNA (adenosine(37)-N6)-dimethylallyltransferase MiaA [Deinococcales bacterium]|nr:tRNA (adenosine(37)-N6)-dimethylallyltransferase MiaA [Chitinophagaceae bacterium]